MLDFVHSRRDFLQGALVVTFALAGRGIPARAEGNAAAKTVAATSTTAAQTSIRRGPTDRDVFTGFPPETLSPPDRRLARHDGPETKQAYFVTVLASGGGATTLTSWPSATSAGGVSATRSPPLRPSRNSTIVP